MMSVTRGDERAPTTVRWNLLAVEPGRPQSPAVVVPEVGREVLDVRLPRADHPRRGTDQEIVRFLRAMPLDVVQDLAAPGDIERPALPADHLGELRVVHAGRVERLAWQILLNEVRVGVDGAAPDHHHEPVEPAVQGARQERAGLLQLEVDLDPNGLPVLLDDLYRVQEIRTEPTAGLQRHLAEGAGPAGFGTPWPSANALLSRISFQLFASIIAWRTRTSLNGSRGARRIGP